MADIKQAARWMSEGKTVRRPHKWDTIRQGGISDVIYFGKQSKVAFLTISDLLADDWEIVT